MAGKPCTRFILIARNQAGQAPHPDKRQKEIMAIYHLNLRHVSRATGKSAVAKFNYICRLDKYENDNKQVVAIGSANMPKWVNANANAPKEFWVNAEKYERANARLCSELEISLPREFTPEQNLNLINEFIEKNLKDMPLSWAIHNGKNGDNPHIHIIYSHRKLDGIDREAELFFKRSDIKNPAESGTPKARELISKNFLYNTREQWAEMTNKHLEKAGINERITHESLIAQELKNLKGAYQNPMMATEAIKHAETFNRMPKGSFKYNYGKPLYKKVYDNIRKDRVVAKTSLYKTLMLCAVMGWQNYLAMQMLLKLIDFTTDWSTSINNTREIFSHSFKAIQALKELNAKPLIFNKQAQDKPEEKRIYIKVNYDEVHEITELGGIWDKELKKYYITDKDKQELFTKFTGRGIIDIDQLKPVPSKIIPTGERLYINHTLKSELDELKQNGAQFDGELKKWFIDKNKTSGFEKYIARNDEATEEHKDFKRALQKEFFINKLQLVKQGQAILTDDKPVETNKQQKFTQIKKGMSL